MTNLEIWLIGALAFALLIWWLSATEDYKPKLIDLVWLIAWPVSFAFALIAIAIVVVKKAVSA